MEKLNHWISLAANLGVLIGIIFLTLQINQSNRLGTNSAEADLRTMLFETNARISETPALAEVLSKFRAGSDNLTPSEKEQAISYAIQIMITWNFATESYEANLLSETTYNNQKTLPEAVLNMYPGSAKYFSEALIYFGNRGTSAVLDNLVDELTKRGY